MKCASVSKTAALKTYLGLVADLPRLTRIEQEELERLSRSGDPAAGRALAESFLPLVVAEANALRGRGLRFEALIAAGNRGLSEALLGGPEPLASRVSREVSRALKQALGEPRRGTAAPRD